MRVRINGRLPRHLRLLGRLGVDVDVQVLALPPGVDSLDFLEPFIGRVSGLLVTDWDCRDLSILERATAIREIDVIQTSPRSAVDVGRLSELRSFAGRSGPQWCSALGAEKLTSLFIDHAKPACVGAVPAKVQSLTLASASSVSELPPIADLEELVVHGSKSLRLASLRHSPYLRSIRLESVRSVDEVGALADAENLESVIIEKCSQIEGLPELARSHAQGRVIGPVLPARAQVLRELAATSRGRWILPPAIA